MIDDDILKHPCLLTLGTEIDLKHMCGFITMLKVGMPRVTKPTRSKKTPVMRNNLSNEAKAQRAEIDEFLHDLRELGIYGMESESQTPADACESSEKIENRNGISNNIGADSSPLMEWVPLEMSIGIPLFCGDINKAVCKKVTRICKCRVAKFIIVQILDYHLFYEDRYVRNIVFSYCVAKLCVGNIF